MDSNDPVNILLVGDRAEARLALDAGDLGVSFVCAATAEEALHRLIGAAFAAVILDVGTSKGLALAKRIRDGGDRVPILFLSTGEDFPIEEAYALGAVDHLPEPIVGVVLRARMALLVELFRRARGADRARKSGPDELWRTTLASIGDAVIATDNEGRVTFLNPVAELLTGWPLADARGTPLTEVFRIVNETSRQPVENPAIRALQTGLIVGLANHTILIARDGTGRPIDDSVAPIRGDSGGVAGAVLVFRDITERRKVEVALARLAAIVESSHDAIVGKNLDGIIQSWNAGAERIFGYTAAEAIGQPVTLIIPPDRLDEERVILERLRKGERVEHFETRRVRKDGRLVDLALTISPIRDSDGHITGASKVARDVTDAKRAERALASALQAGEIGTYYWDIRADRVNGDRNFARIFGVLADEHAWAPVGDFLAVVHPDDRGRLAAEIGRTVEGDAPFRSEYRVVSPAGTRWVLARGAVERTSGGDPVGWAGVVVDITDRKRTEEALAASRARLDYSVRAAGLGFWYCDLPFDELQWDERVKAHFWLPPDARVTIDTFYERIHPDDRGPTRSAIERSIIERTGYDVHYRTVDPATGAEKWIRAIGGTDYDESGAPKRFDGVTLDATEQRRAEALLREKDERLKLLVDRARDYAVVVTDRDGRVVEWSGGAEGITGFAPGEIVGRPSDTIFTPEDRAVGVAAREMAKATREGRAEYQRWHVRKDGNQFFADGVMVPLRGDDGALHGFGLVFRDVTDRKRTEESVRFLADASASLAELIDYQSTLNRIANLAIGGFADWCVVDMIGEDGKRERLAVTAAWADLEQRNNLAIRPDDSAASLVPHVLRTGEPEVVTDTAEADPATAPQGPERLARLRGAGVRSYLCVPLLARGRVIGGMTFLSTSTRRRFGPDQLRVAQNLAERVTVAIENAQLYRTLQEQDRRKDEFLATLAHELRNPLAPIRNGLQILRMDEADRESAETLSMMDRQLKHVTHLVDDLMDVARVSSGKVALRLARVPLRVIIDSAVETSRQAIESAGHEFALRLPREPLTVEADRTRLVQVLANLLNNAAKYTPHGGRIALSVKQEGGLAAIRVADTGLGIPPEMLPRVFEMFTQVGTSLERSQGGLGIGLTLVKRLVEMHGGTVAAESPGPGQGSTFTVRIPLVPAESPAAPTAPVAASGTPDLPLDILVVDDNRDSALTLARLLKRRGHRVKTAHDGPEALRVLANLRPDLILLDLGLPGMSGYEVAHRIRESTGLKGVTLTALTGWGQEEDRRRTREAGFDYHLVKPADPDELEAIVRSIRPGE